MHRSYPYSVYNKFWIPAFAGVTVFGNINDFCNYAVAFKGLCRSLLRRLCCEGQKGREKSSRCSSRNGTEPWSPSAPPGAGKPVPYLPNLGA